MDRAEVLDRVRQATSKRLDVALARLGYRFARASDCSVPPALRSFFFDAESLTGILAILRERFPERAEEIIAQARRYCAHRFDLLGYRGVQYGETIDWHADMVHRKSAPRAPFHRVPYFDYGCVGDPKITWELNRHQHFVTLAKAFRITGDLVFATEISAQWESWRAANPYPVGINWASSLEAAFRALSWLWTYFLLDATDAMTPRLRSDMLETLALSARHIERYLSTYSSPNTHLLGEGVALFFIGTLCPSMRCAQRWQDTGWSIVLSEAQRQVRPDGMHFEHSAYYHVYALDFLVHAMILGKRNGVTIPDALHATVVRMLEVLCRLTKSGLPRLGDDDGGRVFDGRRNCAEHMPDPIATGAILFDRGDFKSVAGTLREETLWLLGRDGVAVWDRLQPSPYALQSRALPDSRLYFMGGNDESLQALADAGTPGSCARGHWHAGCLSVCLSTNGKPLLIDPGTCTYADSSGKRSAFRATSAHNTMQIAHLDQAEGDGPFGWTSLPRAHVDTWVRGEQFDLFSATHDGYARLRPGLIHRRIVFSLHSRFVFVRDAVLGSGEEHLEQYWHLAPELARADDEALVFLRADGEGLALASAPEHGWLQSLYTGRSSPVYGCEEEAIIVRFSAKTALPAEFAVVASPIHARDASSGRLRRMNGHSKGSVNAYSYRTKSDTFFLFFAQPGALWTAGRCTSDAEALCLKRTDGELTLAALCNGTFASIDGRELKG